MGAQHATQHPLPAHRDRVRDSLPTPEPMGCQLEAHPPSGGDQWGIGSWLNAPPWAYGARDLQPINNLLPDTFQLIEKLSCGP